MPSASITGSQAHRTVVTPASLSWAMMFDAWFGIDEMSSLYRMLTAIGRPAALALAMKARTDSWYSWFSGATTPKTRFLPLIAGPAKSAFEPGGNRDWKLTELDSTTLVPSGKRLHE